jgi:hypothetical protein
MGCKVICGRPFLAEQDRAMAVVAVLNAPAKFDKVLVGIDNAALERLRRTRIVATIVERDPPTPELVTPSNLRPGHPTTHAINLVFRS